MGTCAATGLVLPRSPTISSSSLHVNLKRLQLLIPSSPSPVFSFPASSSSLSLVGGALTFCKTLPSRHHSSPSRLFYCSSPSPLQASPSSSSVDFKQQHRDDDDDNDVYKSPIGGDDDDYEGGTSKNPDPNLKKEEEEEDSKEELVVLPRLETPKLSVKEKKELASFAHSLGKKLKSQQVGKSGVTPSVAAAFLENLESNELLKLKIHGSCPDELIDAIKKLEEATGSVAVDQIGRTVILYRPSLSKMKKRAAVSQRKPKEHVTFKFQKKGESPARVSGEKRHQFRRS
ncbi:uncharacterized protein A4U43_C04F35760 [Asparagus officinalis]|uniref:CRM domain-containing protein n=1 Tax=Asparagus officinalis TaxID=4686 RepID=A0A5P1F6T4_ASPOF|nr:uncharacterized protein LOC109839673 isoform X2 [Asparagus officinalis]ONK73824.1 uncharacterized protein A4U43_C04F35760 [Asparagus officinalis]